MNDLIQALEARNLTVEEVDGLLNVSQGRGIMAHKANIDVEPFERWLSERPDAERERFVAGYANGVKTVLLEPPRSDARSWGFVESAGSIMPTVEVESFVLGVEAATGGEPAWAQPLGDDVVLAWIMRLNRGLRAVTAPQFEDWGVTKDRVTSAGRSLLFHRTRGHEWAPVEGHPEVSKIRVGDGHDAARILVVEDVFFGEVDAGWRFAFPNPDLLLAVDDADRTAELRAATNEAFETSDSPLSTSLWKLTSAGFETIDGDDR